MERRSAFASVPFPLTRTPIVSSRQVARQSSLKVTERCSATSMVIQKTRPRKKSYCQLSQSVMLFRYRPARQKVTTPHLLPDSLKPASSNGLKNSALVDRQRGPQLFRRFKIGDTSGRRAKRSSPHGRRSLSLVFLKITSMTSSITNSPQKLKKTSTTSPVVDARNQTG